MTRLLYLMFFASGATGLVYEVIWVRLTGLVFGNTSFSIATVLGAFMTGLALGSWFLGAIADRCDRPLRMYGFLEVFIGVTAVLVPIAFRSVEEIYWSLAPTLSSVAGAEVLIPFITSFAIMLVPTFLMGGTLPVLSRFFVRSTNEVDSKPGALYALNTFGAATGTLAAALILIPGFGNWITTVWVASLNVGLGLLAIRLDLGREATPIFEKGETSVPDAGAERPRSNDRLVLLTLLVSGFGALTYEVAWTRALSALIGSSTYAFAIMLVTFLVGIGLGSAWASRRRPSASIRTLGLFQLGIAFGGMVFLVGYLLAPYLLVSLMRALSYSFPAVLTVQFVVCASLMILATFFMGATFPIGVGLYSNRMQALGRSIGGIYSVNTVGAILGSLSAGFLLVPVIGTERTILTGLFLNSALALLLLARERGPTVVARWAAIGLLVVSTLSMRGEVFWDPSSLDRGVLIYARQFEDRPGLRLSEHYADTDVVYFKEGKNANISVRRGANYVGLRTNGKVDASNGNDMATQLLIGYLPRFHHPSPDQILVVGYGAGITTGVAAVFPETVRVDCVEIEPAVLGAAPWFDDVNRRSYDNPKVNIIEGDARNFLNVSSETYDIIISEPSNPWIAGVGSLFTAEFYELAAARLKPDGVFAQWLQLYELSPDDVRMVLGEFQRQFPEVSVWEMGVGDLVLLGSRQPLRFDAEGLERIVANDESVRRDFQQHLELSDPLAIFAAYTLSSDEVEQFVARAPRNTDDRPVLEFNAPRNLFRDTWDMNVRLLNEYRSALMPEGLSAAVRERAYVALMAPLLARDQVQLAAQGLRELAEMEESSAISIYIATARLSINLGRYEDARESLRAVEQLASEVGQSDTYGAEREELWAQLYEQSGDQEQAIESYRRGVDLDPSRTVYLQELAELYALSRQWDDAAIWMERYIQTDPYAVASYWELLGEYLIAGGREREAVAAFERALDLEPYSYLARLRIAEVFEGRGEFDAAIGLLEFLSVYAPDRNVEIYTRLAHLYTQTDQISRARRVLDQGARIFPTDTTIYRQRMTLETYSN